MKCAFLFFSAMFTVFAAADISAVAHLEEKLVAENTVVWSLMFQAAWDETHRGMGVPQRIDPPNEMMTRLDQFKWNTEAVMPKSDWKVWGGEASKELLDRANAEAKQMTGDPVRAFNVDIVPGVRIGLALLNRNLEYPKELHRSLQVPMDFVGTEGKVAKVSFFGTRGALSDEYGEKIQVLAYGEKSHALQIASKDDDAVVLYLPDEPVTFERACAQLREWRLKKLPGKYGTVEHPYLHKNDDVRIPYVKFHNKTNFAPLLKGGRIYGILGDPWRIYHAEQRVDFELTEKGAKARLYAETGLAPFGEPPPPPPTVPRKFHYDRPFFVFLWRDKAEWPYFGAWMGNSEAMEMFKKQ